MDGKFHTTASLVIIIQIIDLAYIRNRIGPSMDLWGTSLNTSNQLDLIPFIQTL